jgi:hypothetical protein
VELGLRVCVVEDQHRFILHHRVMEKTTDDQVAVPVAEQTKQRFPSMDAISFDKGFHSPANQSALKEIVGLAVLPRKGKLSEAAKAMESGAEFARLRRQHSAVESAINALGHHGLDRCPDHGIVGFKRYVALAGAGPQPPAPRRRAAGAGGRRGKAKARAVPKSGLTRGKRASLASGAGQLRPKINATESHSRQRAATGSFSRKLPRKKQERGKGSCLFFQKTGFSVWH